MLTGFLDRYEDGVLYGWAAWKVDGEFQQTTLDVYVDAIFVRSVVAKDYRSDLFLSGVGDGAHGFQINIGEIWKPHQTIEFRSKNGAVLPMLSGLRLTDSTHEVQSESLVKRIKKIINAARLSVRLRLSRVLYFQIDVLRQRWALRRYTHNIVTNDSVRQHKGKVLCAFVYHEPDGGISQSVKNITRSLQRHGVDVVILSNTKLSAIQKNYFEEVCSRIVIRGNVGFDFGAYKDFFNYVLPEYDRCERVLVLNDSVFYSSAGIDELVLTLLGDHLVIAPFENWGEDHHLQSFCLSISIEVARSKKVCEFWEGYKPIGNRLYAIEFGEKKLTQAILAATGDVEILYSVSDLAMQLNAQLETSDCNFLQLFDPETVPEPWRGFVCASVVNGIQPEKKLMSVISGTSPIHAGAFYFPFLLGCPMFKKDLVYRGRFSFYDVEHWSRSIMPLAERQEYLKMLRRKRDFGSLDEVSKRKYEIGVR